MPGAYGARHARARPSVMQWVLAVRETLVIKPSRLNIVSQGLSNSVPGSIPDTPLSRVGFDQAAGKRAGGVHYKTEGGRATSTLHTHRQASLMVLHYVPPWGCAVGPAHEAWGQPMRHASALVREGGTCHLWQLWRECDDICYYDVSMFKTTKFQK